jgi:hypothetical protein
LLQLRYPNGQHCPIACEDIFVVDEGIISLQDRGTYVLAADDGEVLKTGRKLADVIPTIAGRS